MDRKDNGIEKKGLEKEAEWRERRRTSSGQRSVGCDDKKKRHAQKQKKGKNNSRCLAM